MGHLCCSDHGAAVPALALQRGDGLAGGTCFLGYCSWPVGADTLFSVYFSKSHQWDALQTSFSKRAWAAQPRAAGRLPGFEKVFEASRPCRAPHPCSLRPAALIWAGAGLSVLAESSNRSPFWQKVGSAHQDHIPDAGTEIWEG